MSAASDFVARGSIPAEWQDETSKMSEHIVDTYTNVLPSLEGTSVQAIRFGRNEDGSVMLDEDGNPELVALADDQGNPVMEEHPLVQRARDHGLHAYRYEQFDDGSVVALYVNDPSGQVKMKAFDDLETASLWSPRDERE